MRYFKPAFVAAVILLAAALAIPAQAARKHTLSKGQTIYVPAYSKVYYTVKGQTFPLTTTLIVHNIDTDDSIEVISAKFLDANGSLVDEYIKAPLVLGPYAATDILVKNPGKAKGIGTCFIVKWKASKKVSSPVVECILIGATGQQGISFIRAGIAVEERK